MQQIPQSTVDDARNMLLNMVPMMQNLNRNATLTELASQSTRDWSLVLLNLKTVLDFFFRKPWVHVTQQIQEASWNIHSWSLMLHEDTLTPEAILEKATQATTLLSALSELVPTLKVAIFSSQEISKFCFRSQFLESWH